jgi:hypothetical protein
MMSCQYHFFNNLKAICQATQVKQKRVRLSGTMDPLLQGGPKNAFTLLQQMLFSDM